MEPTTEPESAPISTRRRSIVTMTEKQLLSIDLSLISTEMFPSVAEDEKHSPGTTITEKETSSITVNDQEKDKAPEMIYQRHRCQSTYQAIPAITDEFHFLQDIGWYGSAYHVSNAAFQPLTGKIYRYFSSKWSFFVFLVLFEVGSLACGAAPSSLILITGRVIAGIGSPSIMSGGLTIIAGTVPLEKRPALMGLVIGLANSGSVCGHFAGFLLCAGAAVLFLTALELGGIEYAFNSPTIIGLFCGSAVALVTFLAWNYRKGDEGLIPSMAGKRPVWSAAATNFTFVGSAMIQIYLLPLYFQAVQGATPVQSGINFLPSVLSQLALAYGGGVLGTEAYGIIPCEI
ncbi:hypothetical protein CSAL01_00784 [Colletotrichum salicis]|uniref:Major facilitator superfamily (MFS) profile domain-containing protein n=1 Tax=Colletotrichum salicis TaxID=1209931 RepID=A0A135RVU3_9PEZI|nr:hypothetical protein CSAL01_00784 [Colletotrichum salicis]